MTGMSIEEILRRPVGDILRLAVEQAVTPNYESFCDIVENKLLDIALDIERNKALYHALTEDQLTGMLSISMKAAGFDAEHDTYRNGHTDLLIRNDSGRYEWLGEAKHDNGPAYIMEGFRQLADRYADGNPASSRGGIIIYTQKANKTELLDNWIQHVSGNYEANVSCTERCSETLTARTSHSHHATGVDYRVRHIPISLYYKPTDKSARQSQSK